MPSVSRRFVVVGATVTTAALLVPITGASTRAAERKDLADYEITDWIIIASSGQVTLGLSQPEVGQGSYTALPQILADELDADWERVEVRFVTGRPAYKIAFRQEAPAQKEGASMSTTALYDRLRTSGAAARDVLTRAAARKWGIDVSACRTEKGFVINARGEKLSYGKLARHAARLKLSAAPPLKDSGRFHLIGRPVARLDTGQVQRQRNLRHRRRRPRNAQRRNQNGAILYRASDRSEERSRYPQDARRARRGEDPGERQR